MIPRMLTRIVFGTVMIVLFGAALYADWLLDKSHPAAWLQMLPTTVVLLLLLAGGYGELARMAAAAGVRLLGVSGLLSALAIASIPYWGRFATKAYPFLAGPHSPGVFPLVVFAALAGILVEQAARHRTEQVFQHVGMTLLAAVYLGLGGYFILAIRAIGVPMLVVFLAAVKFTDIGAYFTGSAIGRHKIIPWLSAGKSWEGLVGGLAVGSLVAVGLWHFLPCAYVPSWRSFVWAAAVGLAGQGADMCESLMKRSADLKDSGAVVPEFGGVMDILDSPLLAAPVAMLLVGMLHPFVRII
jgi:phosphatidate cytidylyltransferase